MLTDEAEPSGAGELPEVFWDYNVPGTEREKARGRGTKEGGRESAGD